MSLFLATNPEKIIFGWKKFLKKFWSLFTAKIESLTWGPPKSSNLGIRGQKWPENRQTCKIWNLHHEEICFHCLSATVSQKTIKISGIQFWSQRGGGLQLLFATPQKPPTFPFEIISASCYLIFKSYRYILVFLHFASTFRKF